MTQNIITSIQLQNEIVNLRTRITKVEAKITHLSELFGASVSMSELKLSENNVRRLVNINAGLLTKLEEKLAKVSLPDDTRFYLEESEVNDFRANFQKLTALMTDVEKLYNSMVAYLSNATNI